jgi:hypothetical protein
MGVTASPRVAGTGSQSRRSCNEADAVEEALEVLLAQRRPHVVLAAMATYIELGQPLGTGSTFGPVVGPASVLPHTCSGQPSIRCTPTSMAVPATPKAERTLSGEGRPSASVPGRPGVSNATAQAASPKEAMRAVAPVPSLDRSASAPHNRLSQCPPTRPAPARGARRREGLSGPPHRGGGALGGTGRRSRLSTTRPAESVVTTAATASSSGSAATQYVPSGPRSVVASTVGPSATSTRTRVASA